MEVKECLCTALELEQSWFMVILPCCASAWGGCRCVCTVLGAWSSCRIPQEGRRSSRQLALLPKSGINCAMGLAGLARLGRASRWGEGMDKAGFFPKHSNKCKS